MQQSRPRMVIESVGTYLPPLRLSNAEVLAMLPRPLRIPFEALTGIKSRSIATGEYALDLAQKAAQSCLQSSQVPSNSIEGVLYCSISRYDLPHNRLPIEPSGASRLCLRLGLRPKISLDLNNACSGIMTGLYLANHLIASQGLSNCLVVSGEYISHLLYSAVSDIKRLSDDRLACLTLGDAGAALLVRAATFAETVYDAGFMDFRLQTLGAYSDLCVAYPQTPRAGYMMHTDSSRLTKVGFDNSLKQITNLARERSWNQTSIQHFMGHQASGPLLKRLVAALNDSSPQPLIPEKGLHLSLEFTGNTASTSQVMALSQALSQQKLHAGDNILLTSQASGLTVGVAHYRMPQNHTLMESSLRSADQISDKRIQILGCQILEDSPIQKSTLDRAEDVAKILLHEHLKNWQSDKQHVRHMIYVGTYKSDYIDEPSQAAMLAGRLGINATTIDASAEGTLAFDLMNGSLGLLQSLYLLAHIPTASPNEVSLCLASDCNALAQRDGDADLAMRETAGAILVSTHALVRASWYMTHFAFYQDLRFAYDYCTTLHADGTSKLSVARHPEWTSILVKVICDKLAIYLQARSCNLDDFSKILLPDLAQAEKIRLISTLGIAPDRCIKTPKGPLWGSAALIASLASATTTADSCIRERPILCIQASAGIVVGFALLVRNQLN